MEEKSFLSELLAESTWVAWLTKREVELEPCITDSRIMRRRKRVEDFGTLIINCDGKLKEEILSLNMFLRVEV